MGRANGHHLALGPGQLAAARPSDPARSSRCFVLILIIIIIIILISASYSAGPSCLAAFSRASSSLGAGRLTTGLANGRAQNSPALAQHGLARNGPYRGLISAVFSFLYSFYRIESYIIIIDSAACTLHRSDELWAVYCPRLSSPPCSCSPPR